MPLAFREDKLYSLVVQVAASRCSRGPSCGTTGAFLPGIHNTSNFESLLVIVSDVSESVGHAGGVSWLIRRQCDRVSATGESQYYYHSTTITSFTLFSSRYTLGWPPFVP